MSIRGGLGMWCKKYRCICRVKDCDGTSEDCDMADFEDDEPYLFDEDLDIGTGD